ncbi:MULTISPECIES: hypothetical protein [Halorussus]|uniref:hypothetical protein n=1 Tax=Halorussus TaxID=1070314 RepID=UPI0020A171F5|nr:hypothetical protein [Halorussus vallis]USZ78381.1 hypothetical protein NGM07_22940 [Halorussus vallis]
MSNARSTILREICNRRMQIFYVFALSGFFLLLQLPYLLVVDPNTALFVISVLNVVGLGTVTVLSGAAIWYCKTNA